MENRNACWSCGLAGVPVGGHAWLRKCKDCDVAWNAQPTGSSAERDRVWQQGNNLDKLAAKFDLGDRRGFVDHGRVKLISPA